MPKRAGFPRFGDSRQVGQHEDARRDMARGTGTISGRWARILEALQPDMQGALLALLERDYREELIAAERMAEDAEGIRAEFLRRKLRDIAESERGHALALRAAILRLGGLPLAPPIPSGGPRPGRTFQRLLEDLEEEKQESAGYLRGISLARRAGAEAVEALLRDIRSDEERHTRELLDILRRIDPNA